MKHRQEERPAPSRPHVLPIEELVHPWPLLAVVVLALNDHWLKGAGLLPGWVTGKLSDVAGLFFFPLLLTAVSRVASRLLRRPDALTRRRLGVAIALTAAAFTAIQLWPAAAGAYEWLMPRLDPTGLVRQVRVTMDPADLLALPALLLTWLHGRRFFEAAPPDRP